MIVLLSSVDLNFDHESKNEQHEKPKIELLEDPSLKKNALLPLPPNIIQSPFENELLPLPEETPVPDLLEKDQAKNNH